MRRSRGVVRWCVGARGGSSWAAEDSEAGARGPCSCSRSRSRSCCPRPLAFSRGKCNKREAHRSCRREEPLNSVSHISHLTIVVPFTALGRVHVSVVTQCFCSKSRSPARRERASSGRTVPYPVVGSNLALAFIAYFKHSFWSCACPGLCWHRGTVGLSVSQPPFGSRAGGRGRRQGSSRSGAAGSAPWTGVALLAIVLPGPSLLPAHPHATPRSAGPAPVTLVTPPCPALVPSSS